MNDTKLVIDLTLKMLKLAKEEFSNHGCNDLDSEIIKLIPESWCDEARQFNSKGRDPWPEKTSHFDDTSLMWFLSKKLQELSDNLEKNTEV